MLIQVRSSSFSGKHGWYILANKADEAWNSLWEAKKWSTLEEALEAASTKETYPKNIFSDEK